MTWNRCLMECLLKWNSRQKIRIASIMVLHRKNIYISTQILSCSLINSVYLNDYSYCNVCAWTHHWQPVWIRFSRRLICSTLAALSWRKVCTVCIFITVVLVNLGTSWVNWHNSIRLSKTEIISAYQLPTILHFMRWCRLIQKLVQGMSREINFAGSKGCWWGKGLRVSVGSLWGGSGFYCKVKFCEEWNKKVREIFYLR